MSWTCFLVSSVCFIYCLCDETQRFYEDCWLYDYNGNTGNVCAYAEALNNSLITHSSSACISLKGINKISLYLHFHFFFFFFFMSILKISPKILNTEKQPNILYVYFHYCNAVFFLHTDYHVCMQNIIYLFPLVLGRNVTRLLNACDHKSWDQCECDADDLICHISWMFYRRELLCVRKSWVNQKSLNINNNVTCFELWKRKTI